MANEKSIRKIEKPQVVASDAELMQLADKIVAVIEQGKN